VRRGRSSSTAIPRDGGSAGADALQGWQDSAIPVEGEEWHDSFSATTQDFIEKLKTGGQPRLDGVTGKAVLQFTLAALQSAASGKEVRPEEVA